MKNIIKYFYNIEPNDIYTQDNYHYFYYNNNLYTINKYNLDINEINNIYTINKQMLFQNIPVHQIILNNNNLPLSTIKKDNYILYKINIKNINNKITLSDINKINNIYIPQQNIEINWAKNWEQRIDYLEYQINQMGKKYPNLVESLSYFIGLSENAIQYINNIKKDNNNQYSYSHKKITINSTIYNLYDPCNIIIDYKAKDIAEYIKISLFNKNNNIINELNNYFKMNYISYNSIILLYSRILYPTFYFQMYDDIITNKIEQKKIITIISKLEDYQNYLYEIYLYLKKYYNIPEIEWLKKQTLY